MAASATIAQDGQSIPLDSIINGTYTDGSLGEITLRSGLDVYFVTIQQALGLYTGTLDQNTPLGAYEVWAGFFDADAVQIGSVMIIAALIGIARKQQQQQYNLNRSNE